MKYGYPCRHLFFVMKHEHLRQIPEQLIMKRWTRNAKVLEEYVEKTNDGGDHSFLLRHGVLQTTCHWLFFLGAQHFHLFGKAMKGIRELCRDLERECGHVEEVNHTKGNRKFIRDPVRVRTKGAPKVSKGKSNGRKRKCTKCKNTGHTKRKCLDAYRLGDVGLTGCNFVTISDLNKTCADRVVEDDTHTAYYQRVIDMICTQASAMDGGRFDLNDM
ncbi:hypothetical protein Ahy_B01g053683 [Arachis hypogaea]|uniref:Protein FAR1-RELATED SEQUENCE n=1 Tax=Arachis hypogaea TaxID=3818 RepID=A0A445ASB1_ARAHY|nr:hypothetical protein Ahy_B01g053683 [Arachis hypogaea]